MARLTKTQKAVVEFLTRNAGRPYTEAAVRRYTGTKANHQTFVKLVSEGHITRVWPVRYVIETEDAKPR